MSAAELQRAKLTGGVAVQAKIGTASSSVTGKSLKKIEDSTEDFKVATVNKDLSKAITAARMAKKMTQAQLATAINERAQVIQEYESGKAIPNPQVLCKLDKALGIHLPRGKSRSCCSL